MIPRLKWSDVFGRDLWLEQFNRLKDLPAGTKLYTKEREFEIVHVWDEPHPKRLELSFREGHTVKPYQCRRGDSLIYELQTEPVEVITRYRLLKEKHDERHANHVRRRRAGAPHLLPGRKPSLPARRRYELPRPWTETRLPNVPRTRLCVRS